MAAAAAALRRAMAGLPKDTTGIRWRVFDCKGEVLGRLSSRIAVALMGKDKPTYTPYKEEGDICIVLNAKHIGITGNKLKDKFYRWHTGYIGHLKERSLKDQMSKDPGEVIRKAVMRMLPRNRLRDDREKKLRVFSEENHPFTDKPLEPYIMPPRSVREMRPRAMRAARRAKQTANKKSVKAEDGTETR